MFCVIQTIQRKKSDPHGWYREYEVESIPITFPDGISKTHYSYYPKYEAGRFERPRREAYRISIHKSRREGEKVVKKQCAIATRRNSGSSTALTQTNTITATTFSES